MLSFIIGLLGSSGTSLSADGETSGNSSLAASILGLLGDSGVSLSVDGEASSGTSSVLSSILGLLSGSTASGAEGLASGLGSLSGLASIYNSIANMGGVQSWDDLSFTDNLSELLPSGDNASGGSLLTSILGLLGGTGTALSVDGGTASGSSYDLSSILGLLGGSGTTLSVDGNSSLLTSILGLLGGSGTSAGSSGSSLGSLASIFSSIFNLGSVDSWDDLSFLDTLTDVLPGVESTTTVHAEMTSILPTVTIQAESSLRTAAKTPNAVSVVSWDDDSGAASEGYWIEISRGSGFDGAIRMFTAGTAFDVDGSAGVFSCRATLKDGEFTEDSVEWTSETSAPRQIVSNANGRADIFFASPAEGDVWAAGFFAGNAITGELADVVGKNRIRDTFSGSASDANILYLTDDANGDALFMDDIYSEFGSAARLDLIREIRSGAGCDVIDMTSERYTSELAGMTVRGGSGNDVLWGAAGGNFLFGDEGDDSIVGGSGDDVIAGGSGNDVLNGGGGSDLFTFGENWGDDVVSQVGEGSVTLWFLEDESKISISARNGSVVFRNAAGTSSVTLAASALANLTVLHGDDGSARFSELSAAGAFLGSTAESVFETQDARTHGILASL